MAHSHSHDHDNLNGRNLLVSIVVFYNFGINHVNIQPEYKKDDPKDVIVQD